MSTAQGVDSGPPAVLLVSLVDEEGTDIEKNLVELIPTRSHSQSEEVLREDSGCASNQSHSTSVADSMSVCVTFVSEEGIVFGHDVSPGIYTQLTCYCMLTIQQRCVNFFAWGGGSIAS